MSKTDKDESEAAATGEDSSASIKESIEKNMSLLATLTNHLMRNVDSLSDDEHKSVVEEVNDLYLRVKTMILKQSKKTSMTKILKSLKNDPAMK